MKEKNTVTVNEVRKVIRALGSVLGLIEENQEESLERFIVKFRSMDLAEANGIVQSVILVEDYIETFADRYLEEMISLFPYRAEEHIKAKLMRTESIRVAVALLIIAKSNPTMIYKNWSAILPFIDLFKEVNPYDLDNRLKSVLNYLGN